MNITVFGGSGFLGSHVCDKLSDAGHAVTIFDRSPSRWLRPTQRMLTGDILDEAAVDAAFAGTLAALGRVAWGKLTGTEPRGWPLD